MPGSSIKNLRNCLNKTELLPIYIQGYKDGTLNDEQLEKFVSAGKLTAGDVEVIKNGS